MICVRRQLADLLLRRSIVSNHDDIALVWIRCMLAFSLLRSAVVSICGSYSPYLIDLYRCFTSSEVGLADSPKGYDIIYKLFS